MDNEATPIYHFRYFPILEICFFYNTYYYKI